MADRINRESLEKTEDLYNEIGKLEHMVNKKNFEYKKSLENFEGKEKQEKKHVKIVKKWDIQIDIIKNLHAGLRIKKKL